MGGPYCIVVAERRRDMAQHDHQPELLRLPPLSSLVRGVIGVGVEDRRCDGGWRGRVEHQAVARPRLVHPVVLRLGGRLPMPGGDRKSTRVPSLAACAAVMPYSA